MAKKTKRPKSRVGVTSTMPAHAYRTKPAHAKARGSAPSLKSRRAERADHAPRGGRP
jgi:hypothetical protein